VVQAQAIRNEFQILLYLTQDMMQDKNGVFQLVKWFSNFVPNIVFCMPSS
jgi:hypothetical protein